MSDADGARKLARQQDSRWEMDIARVAQTGQEDEDGEPSSMADEAAAEGGIIPVNSAQALMQNPDLAWIEATGNLQRTLVRSLQDYKLTWSQKRALNRQREQMISEVTEQYVTYLREEAKLATRAALEARDSILRQGLAKLRAKLFTELADVTGTGVTEIERIAQVHTSRITSPALQQEYAKFIVRKVLELLEAKH